jgi:hypothetical protein
MAIGVKNKKSVSPANILAALLIVGFVIIAGILLSRSISVDVNDERIRINGVYGTELKINDIQEIKIVDEIPIIGIKTNGIGLGFLNIGWFTYTGIGQVLVFEIRKGKGNILIIGKEKKVLLGLGEKKNKEIYEELKSLVGDKIQ